MATVSGRGLRADGGGLFLIATVLANLASFGFHLSTSRLLGPAGYGALGSLLGLVTAAALPASALQAAVAQRVATGPDPTARADQRLPWALRHGALAGLAAMAAVAVATPLVDRFLNLRNPVPALFLAGTVGLTVASIAPGGALLGRLRFRLLALALVLGSCTRLALGTLLVAAGTGVAGASAASMLGAAASLAGLCWPVRAELRSALGARRSADRPSRLLGNRPALGSALLALAALAGVSTFLGVDTALARHFLAPGVAGDYAAAATVARVGLFLPGSIALAAFPRLAAAPGPAEQRRLLAEALGLTGLVAGISATLVACLPRLVVGTLFGVAYRAAAGPLEILVWAGAAVGVGSVLVYFFLARRSPLALSWWLALASLVGVVLLAHSGSRMIAWATLGVTASATMFLLAVAGKTVGLPARERRPHHGAPPLADTAGEPVETCGVEPEPKVAPS